MTAQERALFDRMYSLAADILISHEAIMAVWIDKASPEIIANIEEMRRALFEIAAMKIEIGAAARVRGVAEPAEPGPGRAERETAPERRGVAEVLGTGAEWRPIETAPRDGSRIVVITRGGIALAAKWSSIGDDFSTWIAVEDDMHPKCWTDGVCWESNEDGEQSDPPVWWTHLPGARRG
jgi:hypothetical protein